MDKIWPFAVVGKYWWLNIVLYFYVWLETGNNNFPNFPNCQIMVNLWKYHSYDVMPLYNWVVLHTFVRVLTKIRQKWCPLVKLYRSVCINDNELHRVCVISWKSVWAPVSISVTSKVLKQYKIQSYSDNSKRPHFIHRFCDEYSTDAAMDPTLLRKLWSWSGHGVVMECVHEYIDQLSYYDYVTFQNIERQQWFYCMITHILGSSWQIVSLLINWDITISNTSETCLLVPCCCFYVCLFFFFFQLVFNHCT
jgi:hypothetical protein